MTSRPIIVTSSPDGKTRARRLGVRPDVELGRRRHVSLRDRSAHQHDPGRPDAALERQRDVRQRPDRHEHGLGRRRARRGSRRPAARRARTRAAAGPARRARSRRGRGRRRGARATSGRSAPIATGTSSRPTSASTRSALSVVFSSVWLPCTVVTPSELDLGAREREQERDRVVVPGIAVEDDWSRHRATYRVDLGRGRQRRLRAEARSGDRACGARASQRLVVVAALEQRDEQARGEGIARSGAVDRVDLRRLGARDLLPVLEQHRALGAERHRDEAVAALQRLELVAVDDREVGVDVDRPRGRGVQAEQARRLLPGADHRLVGDLELAEDGVARAELDGAELGVRAGRDRDLVLAGGVDQDQRDAGRGRAPLRLDEQPVLLRQRLVRERVVADRADEGHVGAEPRARDGLVRALAAADAVEGRVRDRLARPRQPLDPGDEVEVDAADDGDRGRGSRDFVFL